MDVEKIWTSVGKRLPFLHLEKKRNRVLTLVFILFLVLGSMAPPSEPSQGIESETSAALDTSRAEENNENTPQALSDRETLSEAVPAREAAAGQPDAPATEQNIESLPELGESTITEQAALQEPPAAAMAQEGSTLTVYFIDVGQADSALVVCDGSTMLIDGGNAADSNLIYSFLNQHDIQHLDYIVASHAHEDHVGGLAGALNYATVGTAFCPVTEYDTRAFASFVRYLDKQGVGITIPSAGDSFALGAATVEILSPGKNDENPNNMSIVLKISHNKVSFLFTGDAEREAEQNILDQGYDVSATVLKVGHHGSDTSTTYPFLREVMPQYAVISCGAGNSYGHPHENLLSRLRDAEVRLYRTDMQGDIVFVSDGENVSVSTQRNANVQTNPTESVAFLPDQVPPTSLAPAQKADPEISPPAAPAPEQETRQETPSIKNNVEYIGNVNSLKFHLPSCHTLPAEKNRIYFASREAAISAGYDPCGNCHP